MQIGQWQLIEEIGSGGSGKVYRARDVHTDQLVAVKQMNLPPGFERDSLKQRFLREARAMAKINSDYVVRLYASQIIDDSPVLVMEFLSGGSLATEIAPGPFSPERVVRLLWEALQGLDAVHKVDVVHRDIKPSNLLRAENGRYKIADFGISGQLGSSDTLRMSSVQYAAPEYVSDPSQVDARADLYSLGLCAYEAALGRDGFQKALQQHAGVDPYVATAQWQAWLADASKEVPPLHVVAPEVPLELSKFLSRLLSKNPAQRYASCAVALEELKQLDLASRAQIPEAGQKKAVVDPDPVKKTTAEPPKKSKSQPPYLLIGASVGATVLIAVVALMLRNRPARTPGTPVPANNTSTVVAKIDPPKIPEPAKVPEKTDPWSQFERLADRTNERLQITNVLAAYGVGDSMSIDVVLPRAGYLNILSISEVTGIATVLFPNEFVTDNHFAQAGIVRLPQPGSRYRFAFALPEGKTEEKNLLVAFLTQRPVNARELASRPAAFSELTTGEAGTASGAIVADSTYAAGKQTYLLTNRPSAKPTTGAPQGAR